MMWGVDPKDYIVPYPGPVGVSGGIGQTGMPGAGPLIHKITASDGKSYQVMVGYKTVPHHSDGPAYVFRDEADLARAYIEAIVSLQTIQNTMNGG